MGVYRFPLSMKSIKVDLKFKFKLISKCNAVSTTWCSGSSHSRKHIICSACVDAFWKLIERTRGIVFHLLFPLSVLPVLPGSPQAESPWLSEYFMLELPPCAGLLPSRGDEEQCCLSFLVSTHEEGSLARGSALHPTALEANFRVWWTWAKPSKSPISVSSPENGGHQLVQLVFEKQLKSQKFFQTLNVDSYM